MTVYVDLLFIVNLIMNVLILTGTAALSKTAVRISRLFCAAALGAIYSVAMFFPHTSFLFWFGMKMFVGAMMVLIGIPCRTVAGYGKTLLYFYVCLFVFGGGMYVFYTFTSAGAEMVYSNGIYYVDMPLWLMLVLSFGFYGLIRLLVFWQGRKAPKTALQSVEICCGGKYRTLSGLVDTGNALQDPLTLFPVVIVQVDALGSMLPKELVQAVHEENFSRLEALARKYQTLKCRLIPYRGIAGSERLLFAVRPDWIRCLPDGKAVDGVVIGLVPEALDADKQFEVLLHTEICK